MKIERRLKELESEVHEQRMATELAGLVEKARAGQLKGEDLEGLTDEQLWWLMCEMPSYSALDLHNLSDQELERIAYGGLSDEEREHLRNLPDEELERIAYGGRAQR